MGDHEAVTRRFYEEVMSRGDLELLDELIHDDFVEHENVPPGVPTDKNAPRAFVSMFRSAFPDFTATIEDVIEEGDKVVVRSLMSGTHQGEFMGMTPTNKSFEMEAIDIMAFRDGKVIAHWGVSDNATMMEQLGMIESPG